VYAWVARRFQHHRRRDSLRFAHHPEVTRLAESARADKRLRKVTTLTSELSAGQPDYYSKVAAAHGLPVDRWVTQVLDATERLTA
jgi:hypothetical protein